MGLGADLSVTSDGRYVSATYPGIDGVFVFDWQWVPNDSRAECEDLE